LLDKLYFEIYSQLDFSIQNCKDGITRFQIAPEARDFEDYYGQKVSLDKTDSYERFILK
jgi:hypothetical protein